MNALLKKEIHDTTRANTLCQLAWDLGNVDVTRGIIVAEKAIAFASEKKIKKNIAIAYNALGFNQNMIGNLKQAIASYQNSLLIWGELKNNQRIAKTYSNIGNVYSELPQFDSAQKYYFLSIELCKKYDYKKPLSSAYLNLAALYISKNRFHESIQLLLSCLKIKDELADVTGKANVSDLISVVYKEQKNYKLSLKYKYQSLALWQQTDNVNGQSYVEMGIGQVYYKIKQYDSAWTYSKKSVKNFEGIKNQLGITTGYNLLGLICKATKNNQGAIENFEKSKTLSLDPFTMSTYVEACVNLTEVYTKQANYKLAKKNLDTALNYINKDIQTTIINSIYSVASEYYKSTHDFENALKYFELYNSAKDSLTRQENFIATSELQIKFETEKKENENNLLKAKNTLIIKDRESKIQQRNIVIAVFIIILILSVIIFIAYSKFKNTKRKIEVQKLLNIATIETEHQERERIARDLHDSVGQKLSVLKMQLSMKERDINSSNKILDETIQDIRNVSHNLMPANLNKGLIAALEAMCEQINFSSTTLKIHLNKSAEVEQLSIDKQHTLLIYRMVQELVNNAIKYAQAKNIHISMDCSENQLKLNLSDDGIGFDVTILEKKEGLGIKSIKERVHQLIGKIQLTSNVGKGTQFKISIPV